MRSLLSLLAAPAGALRSRVRDEASLHRSRAAVAIVTLVVLGAGLYAAAQSSAHPARSQSRNDQSSRSFGWFKPGLTPSGWKHLKLPSGGALLFYPPSLTRIRGDKYSVSVAKRDRSGRILVYLNSTPKQGNETLRNWPAFRIKHNSIESQSVHDEGHAFGLWFIGGKGSCVIDSYVTRGVRHHYREIACFVQGRTTASVVVAAALASRWRQSAPLLERAVEAYQVS